MKLFNNNTAAIFAPVKQFVTYFGRNRSLATVEQVNQVISTMNQMVNYRPYDIQFTGSSSGLPDLVKSVMMAGECNQNCSTDCTLCNCYPACNDENTTNFNATMLKTAVGTYTLTISFNPAAGYANLKGIGIFPSALPEPTQAIGIKEKLPPGATSRTFTVKTTDGGVLHDDIIDSVILQIRAYGAVYDVFQS